MKSKHIKNALAQEVLNKSESFLAAFDYYQTLSYSLILAPPEGTQSGVTDTAGFGPGSAISYPFSGKSRTPALLRCGLSDP